MSRLKNDQLFKLTKSLSKAEKRNFKLFANRLQSNEGVLFVKLFDLLDKMASYDEEAVLRKLDGLSKSKLANARLVTSGHKSRNSKP